MLICKNGEPKPLISKHSHPTDIIQHSFQIQGRISLEDASFIAEMYLKGCSLKDIANRLGCSKHKIRNVLSRNKIKTRVSYSHAKNKRKSKFGKLSARPYFGFCYSEGVIVKDPIEYPILELIYRFWKQDKSHHQITLALNKAKILSRTRKEWSWAAVRNIVVRFEDKKVILKPGGKYELR